MSFNKNQRGSIHGPHPRRAQHSDCKAKAYSVQLTEIMHIVFNHPTLPTAKPQPHFPVVGVAGGSASQWPCFLFSRIRHLTQSLKLQRSCVVQSLGTGCPLPECLAFPPHLPCTYLNLSAQLCQTLLAITKLLLCT